MTATQTDSLALALLVVGVLLAAAAVAVVLRLRARGPVLPDDDRAPAGLGRLVPVGQQVDDEVRRGLVALETWLAGTRRATP